MPPKKQEPVAKTEEKTEEPVISPEFTEAPEVEESANGSEVPAEEEKISDIERLTKMMEAQSKQIDLLTRSADKDKLARNTPKETIGRAIRVGTIEGKLVTSWKTLSNIASYRKGEEKVDQTGEFTLEDDTKVLYKIEEFRDLLDPVWVDVDLNKCKFRYDQKGNRREAELYSFTWNGEEREIASTFVNP